MSPTSSARKCDGRLVLDADFRGAAAGKSGPVRAVASRLSAVDGDCTASKLRRARPAAHRRPSRAYDAAATGTPGDHHRRRRSAINCIRLTMAMRASPRSDAFVVPPALQRRRRRLSFPSRSSHVDFTSCCLDPCARKPPSLSLACSFFARRLFDIVH